jgi:hypothetical protein
VAVVKVRTQKMGVAAARLDRSAPLAAGKAERLARFEARSRP